MVEKPIAKIIHYYDNIGVAVLGLEGKLNFGDVIRVEGNSREFSQTVESMQVDHEEVKAAKKGDSIGIKISQKVKKGDLVYKT